MEGTWTTPELDMALDEGYRIIKIHDVYHWEETSVYDKETAGGGLFAQYVNTFLKLKQESSDYPAWAKSEADREKYRRDYLENEQIQLDPANIRKNPGLRALSKLCLNSFWGKFGQRTTMGKTTIVREPAEFYGLLADQTKTITDWTIMKGDAMLFQ